MYFFALKKLKANLIEKPLTERQALPYLIATIAIYTLLIELIYTLSFLPTTEADSASYNVWHFIDSTISFISTLLGAIWVYKCNRADTGRYFLQRYLSVGWVTAMWFFVIMMLVCVLVVTMTTIATEPTSNSTSAGLTLIYLALMVGYYWYFGKQVAEVAQKATYD
jgi:hypothetical protein